MSNLAGWKLAVAAVVVGGGLYGALEVLRPYHHPEVKLEGLVPADAVFADASATSTTAVSTAPAPAPLATTPAPAATVTAAEPVKPASPPPAAEPKPVPPTPVAKVPQPAEKAETKKPVVAEATPAKPAALKPAAKTPTASEKPAAKAPMVPAIAWWQGSGNGSSALTVSYVGSAAFKRAVVVMTNGSFDNPAAPNRSIKVLNASGKPVSGNWEVNATNPGMLIFPVNSNGVYQLVIGADLSDRQNRQLGRVAQGPVEVR